MKKDDSVIKALEKKYSTQIQTLGKDDPRRDVKVVPTGILSLDKATGIGGIPLGYITELYSPDGVGKTTLCIQILAKAQEAGLDVAFIDMEHRFDIGWAEQLGLDPSKLYFTQPPYGEAALNIAQALIEHTDVKLIVIDSIPALIPKKELEGEVGDQFVGLQPRIIAQSLRMYTPLLLKHGAGIIMTNQIRAKIGGMGGFGASNQGTAGGWAVKFFCSLRVDMRRIKTLKNNKSGDATGHIVRFTFRKNSLGVPLKVVDVTLVYGKGFDPNEDLVTQAIKFGIIEQSGAWYQVTEELKVQGRDAVIAALVEDQALFESVMSNTRIAMGYL